VERVRKSGLGLNGLAALIYLCWKWWIEFNTDCILRSPNYYALTAQPSIIRKQQHKLAW